MGLRTLSDWKNSVRSKAFILALSLLLTGGAICRGQKPLSLDIKPTLRGITLSASFDDKLRKALGNSVPTKASVLVVTQDGPKIEKRMEATVTLSSDKLHIELPTEDLPRIPAERKIKFTLSFSGASGPVYSGIRSFAGAIGAKADSNPGESSETAAVTGEENSRNNDSARLADADRSGTANPSNPGSEGGLDGKGGGSVKDDKTKASEEESQKQKDKLASTWHDGGLSFVVLADTLLILIVAGLLVWWWIRERGNRAALLKENVLRGRQSSAVQEISSEAISAAVLAAVRGEFRSELKGIADGAQAAAASVRSSIDRLTSEVHSLKKTVDEQKAALNQSAEAANEFSAAVSSALAANANLKRRSGPVEGASQALSAGVKIASVVNEWLNRGGQNRALLLELAEQAGLSDVRLASYKDAGRASSSGKAEYAFGFTEDGSWLWSKVQGSGEFWAAPADTNFLTMGDAPAVLHKLFDGMQEAGPRFRFRAVYTPCRLRPVSGSPGQFTLVERGLLHLEGSAAPEGFQLVPYAAILNRLQPANSSQSSVPVGAPLGNWIRDIENKVAAQELTMIDLKASAQAEIMQAREASTRQSIEFKRLKAELQQLAQKAEADLQAYAKTFAELRMPVVPTAEQTESAPSIMTSANLLQQLDETHLLTHSDTGDAELVAPSRDNKGGESLVETFTDLESKPLVIEEAKQEVAKAISEAKDGDTDEASDEAKASAITEGRTNGRDGLSLSLWKEALLRARERPESDPKELSVPAEKTYLHRVHVCCDELCRTDRSTQFKVVHFQRKTVSNQSLISLIEASSNFAHPAWQLAVAAFPGDDSAAYLMFPSGMLVKSKYAAVYSALIDDLPDEPFSTEEMDGPAMLLPDKATDLFCISKKIKLTHVSAGGRSIA